jgi:hypothetical protein
MNILDQGILTWHFDQVLEDRIDKSPEVAGVSTSDGFFIKVHPFSKVNDYFLSNPNLIDSYNQYCHLFQNNYQDVCIQSQPNLQRWRLPAIKNAFLYVSVETVFQYPYPYFTEKTFTPSLNKRPFVVLGAPGILAHLKKIGFKTFDKFWDESYDQISDPSTRMEKVAGIVRLISDMPIEKLQNLCYHMQEILDFNYDHYVNTYSTFHLTDKLQQQ